MAAARQVLERNPAASAAEISAALRTEFGMDLSPKAASSYRYSILKKQGGRRRRRRREAAGASASTASVRNDTGHGGDEQGGINDLLRAAQKLGWRRVKEVVDGVLGAPK
jgi:hypothetical protein